LATKYYKLLHKILHKMVDASNNIVYKKEGKIMKNNPRVSIIIPTYNRAHLIENAINSSLKNEYGNIEVIVIDDGSMDETEKIIKGIDDIRIKYIKHEKRMGAPKTKADGVKYSSGEYILFGEDDVLYDSDYIGKLMNCMVRNNADIVAGRIIYMKSNESKKEALERWNQVNKPLIDIKIIEGNFSIKTDGDLEVPFVHALYLTRKGIFDHISNDENYRGNGYREETDPQISALKKGFKIVFCPNAVCYHLPRIMTMGGGQHFMSKSSYLYWTIKNNNYFLKKHYSFLKKKYNLKHSRHFMIVSFVFKKTISNLVNTSYNKCINIFKNSE